MEWVPLFLQRPRRQPNSAFGIPNHHLFHFGHRTSGIRFEPSPTRNSGRRHPPLPCFYPHSNGPFWARCKLGFDRKPRSITIVTNLGLLGAAIYRAVLNRPAIETQSPEQGGGCRRLPNFPDNPWFWRHQLMSAPLVLPSISNRSDSSSRIRWSVSGWACLGP